MGPQCAAKQPGCRAKVISNSVLARCHFGGKMLVWVLLTHGGKSICGDKVYMWRMMIGWHMFQDASCMVIVIWLVSLCWKVNDVVGKWSWCMSASTAEVSLLLLVVVVGCACCCYCKAIAGGEFPLPPATADLSIECKIKPPCHSHGCRNTWQYDT